MFVPWSFAVRWRCYTPVFVRSCRRDQESLVIPQGQRRNVLGVPKYFGLDPFFPGYRGRLNAAQRIAALGAAALILIPPTATIAELNGFFVNAGGIAAALILLGPRLPRRMSAPRAAVGLTEETGR